MVAVPLTVVTIVGRIAAEGFLTLQQRMGLPSIIPLDERDRRHRMADRGDAGEEYKHHHPLGRTAMEDLVPQTRSESGKFQELQTAAAALARTAKLIGAGKRTSSSTRPGFRCGPFARRPRRTHQYAGRG